MSDRNRPEIDLDALEITMFRTITALTEAMVRQAAMEQRGPVISPNPEAWERYVQDLRGDLAACSRRLDEYLASIDWKDSPLPTNPVRWPGWWAAVRLFANRTRYSMERFTN